MKHSSVRRRDEQRVVPGDAGFSTRVKAITGKQKNCLTLSKVGVESEKTRFYRIYQTRKPDYEEG